MTSELKIVKKFGGKKGYPAGHIIVSGSKIGELVLLKFLGKGRQLK